MRINLFAGPGAGKSVVASQIFSHFKIKGYNIELVNEYVKGWAYQKIVPQSFDQYYIFSKQLRSEDIILRTGVKNIVTDSPILMQLAYMKRNGENYSPLLQIAKDFESKYSCINILLERKDISYQQYGRYENEPQAIQMDIIIENILKETNSPYKKIKSLNLDEIFTFVSSYIE